MNNFQSPPFAFTTNIRYNTNMKTTATIVRYIFVLAALSAACFVTWTAVDTSMQGYFDPWMVVVSVLVFATVPFTHFGLKYAEKAL